MRRSQTAAVPSNALDGEQAAVRARWRAGRCWPPRPWSRRRGACRCGGPTAGPGRPRSRRRRPASRARGRRCWAWSEAGTRSRCSPERASQATTVAQHAEATRTRPSRVNASSPATAGDRLDVHARVRAQPADLDRATRPPPRACAATASSRPSGENATAETGAGKRSRRTTARERTSRIVTVPASPPVASRRPSGVKAIASADVPSRAGRSAMRRLVRRSTSVTVPSPRLAAITSPRGATTKQGLAAHPLDPDAK